MERIIDLRVQWRKGERVLRLQKDQGEWYAATLTPGREDFLTGEYVAPSPPGARLPRMELQDMVLRIEAPKGNVVDLEVAAILAVGRAPVKDGWVIIPLRGVMSDYADDFGNRMSQPEPERAQILDFAAGRGKSGLVEQCAATGKDSAQAQPHERPHDRGR